MGAQGTAIIDFGAFPGVAFASVDVTGQTAIPANALVEAWINPIASTDHSVGEHVIDPPRVIAGSVVAGTGFTIYALNRDGGEAPVYGKWNVAWVWDSGSAGSTASRQLLTANATYYVRTDGNDSNSGLVNSPSGAWLTVQHAVDYIGNNIDCGPWTVTVSVQNAAWTTQLNLNSAPLSNVQQGYIWDFNGGTLTVTNNYAILLNTPGLSVQVKNVTLSTVTSGACIYSNSPFSEAWIGSSVTFGACAGYHMQCGANARIKNRLNAYTISGNAIGHVLADGSGALIEMGGSFNITLTGTPAFSQAFAVAQEASGTVWLYPSSYVGSATGSRYYCDAGGVVNTFTNNVLTLPGNADGTVRHGGVYN